MVHKEKKKSYILHTYVSYLDSLNLRPHLTTTKVFELL
jgi:hypothetical protein